MATLSTGDVCKRLGFTINAELITKLHVEPTETLKSHPRWSEENFLEICAGLIDHVHVVAMAAKNGSKPIKNAPKPAAKVDDDDEL